jgi:hypothetical protein
MVKPVKILTSSRDFITESFAVDKAVLISVAYRSFSDSKVFGVNGVLITQLVAW